MADLPQNLNDEDEIEALARDFLQIWKLKLRKATPEAAATLQGGPERDCSETVARQTFPMSSATRFVLQNREFRCIR